MLAPGTGSLKACDIMNVKNSGIGEVPEAAFDY